MRKITYFIVALAMCVLPCSCSLEEETSTEIEKRNYLNNASEAENVLLGVYRTNVEDAMYAYHLSILFIMGTDIAQVEGSTTENWRIILPMLFLPLSQKYNKRGQLFIKEFTELTIFWNRFLEKSIHTTTLINNGLLSILQKPEH